MFEAVRIALTKPHERAGTYSTRFRISSGNMTCAINSRYSIVPPISRSCWIANATPANSCPTRCHSFVMRSKSWSCETNMRPNSVARSNSSPSSASARLLKCRQDVNAAPVKPFGNCQMDLVSHQKGQHYGNSLPISRSFLAKSDSPCSARIRSANLRNSSISRSNASLWS